MSLRPYTDDEWESLPHVILTSDTDWNPSVLDNTIDDDDTWFDTISEFPDGDANSLFDLCGNYRHRHTSHYIDTTDSDLGNGVLPNEPYLYGVFNNDLSPGER